MRTLSMKGGMKRYRETQVVLPMHKSIAPLRNTGVAKTIDVTAMISKFKPESRLKTWARRAVRVVTYFW